MDIPTVATTKINTSQYKLLALVSSGGALEFLDFAIYVLFADYISQNFFPMQESTVRVFNVLAIFAVGYLARPVGGVIFGHFGDKYGRKKAFTISAFMMAFSTFLMGCLPNYHLIGFIAPLLLLLLRLLQGISVGGEIPGATVFIFEHFPAKKRGFAVGLLFMGVTLGNVIGRSIGYGLTSQLSSIAMLQWGWRIPFFAGSVLGVLAYVLRRKTLETPIFLEILRKKQQYHVPVINLLKYSWPQLIIGAALTALSAITIFLFLYLPSYPSIQNQYSQATLYLINTLSFLSLAILTAIFGAISDYSDRRKLIIIASMLAVMIGYFLFTYCLTGANKLPFFCGGIIILVSIVNGCYGCVITEVFPAPMRYSGMGISYNLGFAFFGGISPLVVTLLLASFKSAMSFYYLFSICCMVSLFAAILSSNQGKRYRSSDLARIRT